MSAIARSTTSSTARISSPVTAKRGIAPMSGPSSSVSARSSAKAIPISTTSKIMPALDTAGLHSRERRRRVRWARSLSAKIALLTIILILVPIFLYLQFNSAHEESQKLLLGSVREQGRVISQSLLPLLETADTDALPDLGKHLERFAGQVTTIKLLLAPTGTGTGPDGFYYVASWPEVAPANL